MIDGTEKPKISSKFAKRAARYNEFDSKQSHCRILKVGETINIFYKVIFVTHKRTSQRFWSQLRFLQRIWDCLCLFLKWPELTCQKNVHHSSTNIYQAKYACPMSACFPSRCLLVRNAFPLKFLYHSSQDLAMKETFLPTRNYI